MHLIKDIEPSLFFLCFLFLFSVLVSISILFHRGLNYFIVPQIYSPPWNKIHSPLQPGEPLQLTECCNTSFADLHNCKCFYSYFILLNGCLISWVTKVIKTVLLLTAEAEYFTLTEVIKEIFGVKNILKTVKLKVKTPVSVYCNNLPVIHLTNNLMTKTKIQHINIKFY